MKERGINVRLNRVTFQGLNDSYKEIRNFLQFFKERGFKEKDIAIDEFLEIGRGHNYGSYSIQNKMVIIQNIKNAFEDVYGNEFSISSSYSDGKYNSFCGLGENILYLNSKGDITLCTVLNDEKFKAGNIAKDSVKNIWENSSIFNYFRDRKHIISTKCETCSDLVNCGGGCKAKPMLLSGRFNRPDNWACSQFNQN